VIGGRIRPVIDTTFPLDQAPDAFARMERGDQFGKIVVTMPALEAAG
jgi:zinc-binding alcohol dehydrogenase/oxidoreductase